MHGANRLGGNGVANSTVFGGIAGEEMARAAGLAATWADPDEAAIEAGVARAERPFSLPAGDPGAVRERLWRTMWDDVGVLRTREGIERGLARIESHAQELLATGLADGDRTFNLTWHDWLNLESLIDVSRVIRARRACPRRFTRRTLPRGLPRDRRSRRHPLRAGRKRRRRIAPRYGAGGVLDRASGESLIDGEAGAPPAAA